MDAGALTLPFSVTVERQPGSVSLIVRGDLDLAAGDVLTTAWAELLDDDVVVDLSQTTFIDCAGYRRLEAIVVAASARGARVQLVGASGPVARFLALMRQLCDA